VDAQGKLLGINTAIASPTGAFAGYSFAIPSNLIKGIVENIINYGGPRVALGVMVSEVNQELADELSRMAEVDQIAAYILQGKYKEMTSEQWNSFKDSVFTTHQKRLKEIFDKYGFVGFDLAGEEGSQNFWLMVQHSDHNSNFQKEILEKKRYQKQEKPSSHINQT